jgi:hypothetical protein
LHLEEDSVEILWKKAIRGGIIALLMLGLCLSALPVRAGIGIGLAPASIDIVDALRGAEYENGLRIYTADQQTDYSVAVEGEAAAWLSLTYKGAPVNRITVLPGSPEEFQVKVAVPEDAANNKYTAKVIVTSIPSAVSGGGQAVAVSAYSTISIAVTGTQIIEASVNSIYTEDVETGYPLEIQVFVQNTGNVEVTPIITVNITANENAVGNVAEDNVKVRAGAGQFIIAEWDTTGNAAADYLAMVNVVLDGKTLATEELPFKILPLGTLTRSGELMGIVVNGAAVVNRVTKMTATFSNTGQIDTWAEFTGEIYKGDQLVDTFTGEKLLIASRSEANLIAYFNLAETGDYTIKGWVVFEGKKTETMELTFTVIVPEPGNIAEVNPTVAPTQMAGEVIGNTGMAAYVYVIIGLAGAAAIAAVYFFVWRRRQFVPVFVGSYNKAFKELAHNKLFKKFKFHIKKTKHTGKE